MDDGEIVRLYWDRDERVITASAEKYETEEELVQAYAKTEESKLTIMIETVDGLRFCLEYDTEGGWIYCSQTLRYYRVTEEIASWFSNNLLSDRR